MPAMDRRYSLPTGAGGGPPPYFNQLSEISETNENGPVNKTVSDDYISNNYKSARTAGLTGHHRVIEKLQPPPDGGYGWLIVLSSFFSFFVLDGSAYSFGIFFDAFVEEFGGSRAVTAMAGSLLTGCYMSAGPLVSSLVQKFGCRPVSLIGALFSATSLYLSSCVHNTFLHLITYGLCTGIGFGLIYLPAIVAVSSYFERRRAFATGVALCGSGLGAFAYAPLCQMLLEALGVRQSVAILALLVAVIGSLAAIIMRPLPLETHVLLNEEEKEEEDLDNKNVFFDIKRKDSCKDEKSWSTGLAVSAVERRQRRHGAVRDEPLQTEVLLEPELGRPLVQVFAQDEDNNAIEERRNSILKSNHLASIGEGQKYLSPDFPTPGGRLAGERTVSECYTPAVNAIKSGAIISTGSAGTSRWTMRLRASITGSNGKTDLSRSRASLMMKKDIFYSGSVYRLDQENVASSEKGSKLHQEKLDAGKKVEEEQEISIIKQMLDVSLFAKSRPFVFLALSNFIAFQAFYVPFVYLKQHAQSNVFDGDRLTTGDKAAFLLSFVGITNTLGRMLFGWISDRLKRPQMRKHWLMKHFDALNINNACLLLASISTACTPLLTTYTQVSCNCLIFGLCCAAYMCLTSIILVDLLGLDRLTNAFGLICMCRGIGSMIGPPLAGLLCDLSGSYDYTFYTAGLLFFLSTLLSFAASPAFYTKKI